MATLKHAVGQGGVNDRADVRAVQVLLNRHRSRRAALLKIDGIVGPKTLGAIRLFQETSVGLRSPDRRVDPGGRTLTALNTPPGTVMTAAPPPRREAAVRSVPSVFRPGQSAMPGAATPRPVVASVAPVPVAGAAPQRDVIAWGAKVSPNFKLKVLGITERLGISPDILMACMAFESGETFSPSIRNAAGSGAVGLIQFMPSTAKGLGTSTTALAAMTPERQLDYVERYFRPYKGRIRTIEDIYMTILFPRAIGRGQDYALFRQGTKAYAQNKGLDADENGVVNTYEAAAAVRAKYNKGLRPGYIG